MSQDKPWSFLWVRKQKPLDPNWKLGYQVQRKTGKQDIVGCPNNIFSVIVMKVVFFKHFTLLPMVRNMLCTNLPPVPYKLLINSNKII